MSCTSLGLDHFERFLDGLGERVLITFSPLIVCSISVTSPFFALNVVGFLFDANCNEVLCGAIFAVVARLYVAILFWIIELLLANVIRHYIELK